MSDRCFRFGFHAGTQKTFLQSVMSAHRSGATGIQMFMGNPRGYAFKQLDPALCKAVKEYVQNYNLFFISHSPYVLNLARPLYNTDTKGLERYVNDITVNFNMGGVGSIVHMGSNVKELCQTMDKCFEIFVKNLQWVAERIPDGAYIVLENMSGSGQQMCCNMNEWTCFWNEYVDENLKKRIRWCIDTAHLYANGEYDISEPEEVERFQQDFAEKIGWEYVICIHLNGSKSKLKSHKDCHADISFEKCGEIDSQGLAAIVNLASKTGVSVILETPGDEESLSTQLMLIQQWSK